MKDWIHKDLPSLPMEARVLHHKAQKRVLELEETVTRLLQDVGYAADISIGASPTPAPFRRDLPQSGTHQARTSTPRRTGKSDTIHMKRKALMTIPQKIADVDSNSEESDEEEEGEVEEVTEVHDEPEEKEDEGEANEKKGESEVKTVKTCEANTQTEPEKANNKECVPCADIIDLSVSEPAEPEPERGYDNLRAMADIKRFCDVHNVPPDGSCIAHALHYLVHNTDLDDNAIAGFRARLTAWAKKSVVFHGTWFEPDELFDKKSLYLTTEAIRTWAHANKKTVLVIDNAKKQGHWISDAVLHMASGRIKKMTLRSRAAVVKACHESDFDGVILIEGEHAAVYSGVSKLETASE
ncbi:hypothetical protein J8273_6726 [Carpediemonas membranifera]|uniref:OTU domain-containing protein n=1 Tax=Carpediemonas membranifera TaxID=201153 RepID=A0A8J6AQY0_9EUKA|nr:hypothetical protein J8273_6726 [Carpediemonas membranifera]|eukprot:KAG9391996.1 hypothetical protein J8273_6726 [Carpediemonas membranifera]